MFRTIKVIRFHQKLKRWNLEWAFTPKVQIQHCAMTNISYVENKAPYFQKFNEIEINNDPKYTDLHKVQTVRLWQ